MRLRKGGLRKDESGLASVIAMSMMVMVVTALFTVYQAFGVPGVCKDYEARALSDFFEGLKGLASAQKDVITTDVVRGVPLKTQYSYPTIPFFLTPSYLEVGTGLYNVSVTIENIASDQVQIPSTLTLKGEGVQTRFNALYSTPVQAFVELGLVATDSAYVDGSIINEGHIFIPFFEGTFFTSQLYPLSAGGKGILVRASDPSKNITIKITGSKIPENAWRTYADMYGLDITYTTNPATGDAEVTISLPPGNYTLASGIASFGEGVPKDPTYLVARSPINQRSPAVVDVEVVDEYFNPVPSDVTFKSLTGSVKVCSPTTTGSMSCDSLSAGDETSFFTEESSAVVENTGTGTAVLVTSIDRSVGGPYQLAFSVTRT